MASGPIVQPPRLQPAAALGARALLVLTLVNMVNYIDRWMVPPLFESLKKDPVLGHPSDGRLGLLMTAFVIVYMLASPVFGVLGDRMRRTRLIAFGVALWSLATATAGLAGSFLSLFLARATVGIGESAYGTIAPALLADYYAPDRRGRVMAIFACAIPIGSALGYVIGGLVDAHFGWRAAFYVAGVPGLILAALVLFTIDDPPRGTLDVTSPATAPGRAAVSLGQAYRVLAQNRLFVLTCAGYAAYTFALGGIASWLPSFLERVRGVPHAEAAIVPGAIVVVTGFVGTFAGGWLADRLLKRNRQAYWWVSGITALMAAPVAVLVFTSEAPTMYWSAAALSEVLLFASTGPINAATVNIVSPTTRATALAAQILIIHLFGDVPSPPLIGALSDAWSLGTAVLVVPVAILIGGVCWILAARHGARLEREGQAG
jgi:MFS transporter, Spinster family, sphingosine-1-phosphate transporter